MRVFSRYVFRQLAQVTCVVTGALLAMVWLTQSLRFMDLIVNRGLPFGDFVYLLIFLVPWFLGIVLPIAVFVAVLFVYNRLDKERELIVCQACGLSPGQIARPAILLACLATGLGYAVMLYFYPASYHAFKNLQYEIRHDHATVLIREGRFNDLGEDLTIYVERRTDDGALRNILLHDTTDRERPVTMMAESGVLVRTAAGPRVVLKDGNRQVRDRESGELSILSFQRYTLDLGRAREPVGARWRQPQERYLGQLLDPKDTPRDQRRRRELIAEGHHRIVLPVYTLAFAGVALAAVLAPRARRGLGGRMAVSVAVVALLQMGHLVLNDLGIRQPDAIKAMYLLAGLAVAVPFSLLQSGWRRRGRAPWVAAAVPRGALAGRPGEQPGR